MSHAYEGALQAVRNGETVADLAIGHGFESESGFRAAFARSFGRAPADAGLDPIRVAWLDGPLGPLLAAARDEGIVLLDIACGRTCSYDDLARAVGRPGACRAVGTANGRNRIAIVVPCHRVVNKNGQLGGYGGGLWRKQRLRELECTTPAPSDTDPAPHTAVAARVTSAADRHRPAAPRR